MTSNDNCYNAVGIGILRKIKYFVDAYRVLL